MEKEEKTTELDDELDDVQADEDADNDADSDGDEEFEYDENGDIIIPDVDEEDQDGDSEDADADDEDEGEEDSDDEGSEDSKPEAPPENKEDERDKKIAQLEKELAAFKSQAKDTLSKLGVKADSELEGLEKVAAESDDISLEDYRKKKAESQRNDEALRLYQKAEFEKKMRADLEEVQREFPETKSLKSISEIENFAVFGRLRDLGLTPKQAYVAANADSVRKSVATATKQQSLNETKAHLKSAVPKGSKDETIVMSKKDLAEWRDLFPNMSDKEIVKLYKESFKK